MTIKELKAKIAKLNDGDAVSIRFGETAYLVDGATTKYVTPCGKFAERASKKNKKELVLTVAFPQRNVEES